jgi:hypothetical protein
LYARRGKEAEIADSVACTKEMRNAYKILVGEPKKQTQFGRCKHKYRIILK